MTAPPIEPELDLSDSPPVPVSAVEQWRAEPTPENLGRAVDSIHPKIAYHLHRHGLGSDPLAVGHARVLAAKAIQSYNPEAGAQFNTWLDRSMMPLTRFRRLRATAIKVPEKIQLDNMKLSCAAIDYEDEHGREPELDELADHAGIPVKRIHQIRATFRKMPGEAAFEGNLPAQAGTDFMTEALDVAWDEGDKLDRKILEMRVGYGGKHEPMQPKDIAARLGISPVELSRRSSRLGVKLDTLLAALER